MAIAEISIVPVGTKTTSLSKHVARAIKVLQKEENIKYELTSMGTIIEGKLTDILRTIEKMHESSFDQETYRLLTTIRIDDRRDKVSSMSNKVASVKRKL
jgi:uncharacterized protein (TIGR00106 family)